MIFNFKNLIKITSIANCEDSKTHGFEPLIQKRRVIRKINLIKTSTEKAGHLLWRTTSRLRS